jgi:DNA-binding LacI/PurR family transcriptional regulator
MPITIKDIAKELDISFSTVSRALRDDPQIAEETRKRVKKMAKNMGYRKSSIGSALVTGKNNVLGVIVADMVRPFNLSIIGGAEKVARDNEFNIISCNSRSTLKGEKYSTEVLMSQNVSGIIFASLSGYKDVDHILMVRDKGIEVAVINRFINIDGIHTFVGDYLNSTICMMKHLFQEGHEEIAFVGFDKPLISQPVVERLAGYGRAMKEAGLKEDLVLRPNFEMNTTPEMEIETGRELTERILMRKHLPSAILATNDFFAIGALRAFYKKRLIVPNDITVVCCDDIVAPYQVPPLTTLREPYHIAGERAAQFLIERIKGNMLPIGYEKLDCELVIRESCRCSLR